MPTAGRFSRFDRVDRTLAVVEGRLQLAFDDRAGAVELTPESPPHVFRGEAGVIGTPIGGPVLDLNLMTARGRCIERAPPRSGGVALASPCAIVLFASEARFQWSGEAIAMQPFDAVRIDGAAGEVVGFHSDGEVYVASLFSRARDGAG